ncbi:MAG: helix-turn-helix domain-containing protein, partial [Actinomycetota bacterium]|nr:helix-turn-helix domain-containing protein [Actinomycetota bacterium]
MGRPARRSDPQRDYRTEIPNLIDEMGLSVYAYRLYGRIKRRAGDTGVCDEGTKSLATGCGMSAGTVSKAKKELEKRGLISIRPGDQKKGETDKIRVVDVWEENFARFVPEDRVRADLRLVESDTPRSPDEHPPSSGEHPPFTTRTPRSPGETKKELRSVEERPPNGGPKKPAASTPPVERKGKRTRIAKLDDE